MPFLERLYLDRPTEVVGIFQRNADASLVARLEQLSVSLTELAAELPLLDSHADAVSSWQERCPGLMAAALRTHFPDKSEAQVRALSEMMIWTAEGVLEGALRRSEVSAPETRSGLLAAWRGILAGWGWKP